MSSQVRASSSVPLTSNRGAGPSSPSRVRNTRDSRTPGSVIRREHAENDFQIGVGEVGGGASITGVPECPDADPEEEESDKRPECGAASRYDIHNTDECGNEAEDEKRGLASAPAPARTGRGLKPASRIIDHGTSKVGTRDPVG